MFVEICSNHTGKMEGIKSLSTSVLKNPNCQKNQAVLGSVCAHCYAENLAKMYSGLAARLERNTKILTTGILEEEEIPNLFGEEIFRFEAFGDLNNETQLKNYILICEKNPSVRFSLYTKMYLLAYNYFIMRDNPIPENLTLVLSSFALNKEINLALWRKSGKFKKGQLKSFTVYTGKFIKDNKIPINCGARCCNKCRLCYSKNEVEEIREILKSDRDSTETYLKMQDEKYVDGFLDNILGIWR